MSGTVQYVSQGELEALLIRVMGAKAIGVVALTKPSCFYKWRDGVKPTKKNGLALIEAEVAARALPPVAKRQHVTGISNFEYERSRNNDNAREWSRQVEALRAEGKEEEARALEQEGPQVHELKGRKNKVERIEGTPFARHPDGHLYLQMMIPTGNNSAWPSGRHETAYVNPETGEEYGLKVEDPNSLAHWLKPYKRYDSEPHDFDYREYRTDHILEVRHEGVQYIVRQGEQSQAAVA